MMTKAKISTGLLAAFLFCLVSVPSILPAAAAEEAPAEWIQSSLEKLAGESSQVLLVTGEDSSGFTAMMYVLEKKDNRWRNVFRPLPALIGRNGFAPPGGKKEGDVRTPIGVFALKRAFGYAAQSATRLTYRQAGDNDIWVDDVTSPDYNCWVRKGETSAASFEAMKLNDDRYKYGIVVEYNTDPVVKGAGSAIFIHVRRRENMSTLGCVALSERDILQVLGWLDPKRKPLAILGTRNAIVSLAKGERASSDCLAGEQKRYHQDFSAGGSR
jgi:L,D-peptidoglycan transpeptidase YkuD (ErfK/YbiS/YcfS/YnhG family)